MGTRLASGVVAGLAGGVVFGILATLMTDVVAGHGLVSLMRLIGQAVGSGSLLTAWMIVLAIGVLLGALFGILAGRPGRDTGAVASYGLLYGLALGLLVGFVAVPLMLGRSPSSREIWPWLPATLVACLLFASALAGTFVWLQGKRPGAGGTRQTLRRAA